MTRAQHRPGRHRRPRLGPQPAQTSTAADIAADARAALGQLAAAWTWLGELRQPGAPGPAPTRPRPATATTPGASWRDDRAAALDAVRAGAKPAGPHAAPANLHIVNARARIAGDVTDLAVHLWDTLYGSGLLYFVREPDPTRTQRPCAHCAGRGVLDMPYLGTGVAGGGELTPPDPIACPRCHGGIIATSAGRCPACQQPGPCGCDRADLAVALHTATIDDLLDVVDVETAAHADATLTELAAYATTAAGAGRDHRRIPGLECPACGGRDLTAEVSSTDPRKWSITCHGPDCVCVGPGCDCAIGTDRRANRHHRWPASTWYTLRDQIDRSNALPAVLAYALRVAAGLPPTKGT